MMTWSFLFQNGGTRPNLYQAGTLSWATGGTNPGYLDKGEF